MFSSSKVTRNHFILSGLIYITLIIQTLKMYCFIQISEHVISMGSYDRWLSIVNWLKFGWGRDLHILKTLKGQCLVWFSSIMRALNTRRGGGSKALSRVNVPSTQSLIKSKKLNYSGQWFSWPRIKVINVIGKHVDLRARNECSVCGKWNVVDKIRIYKQYITTSRTGW